MLARDADEQLLPILIGRTVSPLDFSLKSEAFGVTAAAMGPGAACTTMGLGRSRVATPAAVVPVATRTVMSHRRRVGPGAVRRAWEGGGHGSLGWIGEGRGDMYTA